MEPGVGQPSPHDSVRRYYALSKWETFRFTRPHLYAQTTSPCFLINYGEIKIKDEIKNILLPMEAADQEMNDPELGNSRKNPAKNKKNLKILQKLNVVIVSRFLCSINYNQEKTVQVFSNVQTVLLKICKTFLRCLTII